MKPLWMLPPSKGKDPSEERLRVGRGMTMLSLYATGREVVLEVTLGRSWEGFRGSFAMSGP